MTIKRASEVFNLDEKIIRKSIKDGMLEKRRVGKMIEIPDDTKFIPQKRDIKNFLFHILCCKNNAHYPVPRKMCPNNESLKILLEYLYCKGFIIEYDFSEDTSNLFHNIVLTDDAIAFIFGKYNVGQITGTEGNAIQINPTIKFGVINL
ncbi:MAG: hypothetical protein II244_00790 [Clostridia bacterium]|nr:hypothetical protein [Clostridia bacterium]